MATLSDSNEVWENEIRDAHEKTGCLSLWERTELLTISQMAALSWVGRRDNELSQMPEIVGHHRKLILRDCLNGTLNPIHPVTFIPYSSYLLSGAFDKETELPIPNASWCIDYFQVEKWYLLNSKSVDLNYAREGLYGNTLSRPTPVTENDSIFGWGINTNDDVDGYSWLDHVEHCINFDVINPTKGLMMILRLEPCNDIDMAGDSLIRKANLLDRFLPILESSILAGTINTPCTWESLLRWATGKGALDYCDPETISVIESKYKIHSDLTTDKPLTTTERNTLLTIIGILAKKGYGFDLSKPYECAKEIQRDADDMGVKIGDDTIAAKLKEAAKILAGKSQ